MIMAKIVRKVSESAARYYDAHGIVGEIDDGPVEFALDAELKAQILTGKRTRRLENVSIKLDRAQIQAVRKIATMKSIPYQTLIRHWLGEAIRHELRLDTPRRRPRRPAAKKG
jgi:hypothetical protein